MKVRALILTALIGGPLLPAARAGLSAWGADYTTNSAGVPSSLSNVTAVESGGFHSLALRPDGSVSGWGDNSRNQVFIPPQATNIVSVAAGLFHSLALAENGSVFAWGADYAGLTNVPATLTNAAMISAGGFHNLGLTSEGTVTAWGENLYGQIDVPCRLYQAAAVAAGGLHSLALRADGTIVAWGDNRASQLNVPAGLTGVIALAAGFYHSLALTTNGTVVAWGSNAEGQTSVPAGLTGVVAIAAGYSHSLALKSDGSITAWGSDLGPGETRPPALLSPSLDVGGGFGNGLALINDAASDDAPELLGPSGDLAITGLPFSARVAACGQDLTYSASNLPAGLLIHPQTGIISGTAETSGVFNVTLTATNSEGSSAWACSLIVLEATPTVITNAPVSIPTAWLASYCFTNLQQAVLADPDHDNALTWQEYLMDTDPTDADSVLEIRSVNLEPGSQHVEWIGGTGVLQYLEWTPRLDGTNWSILATNIPPTPITNLFNDSFLEPKGFYRVRAVQ